jgi:hypothetical protein
VELLIDRVVVTDGQVEIRYVIPTTPGSTRTRFCHLRTDYFDHVALPVADWIDQGWPPSPWSAAGPGLLLVGAFGDGVGDPAPPQQAPAGRIAVAPVSDQVGGALAGPPRSRSGDADGVQQRAELGALMPLAGGDQHRQGPAAAVTSQMQLGRQAAAAAAQCLVGLGSRP